MAKAQITTKTGGKIIIEGDPGEVAAIVRQVQGETTATARRRGKTKGPKAETRQKPTPTNLILSLIDGGFFRKPKDLVAVKGALEELGHYYPVTTLSPVLLRLVRKREFRRIKEKKRWLYTG